MVNVAEAETFIPVDPGVSTEQSKEDVDVVAASDEPLVNNSEFDDSEMQETQYSVDRHTIKVSDEDDELDEDIEGEEIGKYQETESTLIEIDNEEFASRTSTKRKGRKLGEPAPNSLKYRMGFKTKKDHSLYIARRKEARRVRSSMSNGYRNFILTIIPSVE